MTASAATLQARDRLAAALADARGRLVVAEAEVAAADEAGDEISALMAEFRAEETEREIRRLERNIADLDAQIASNEARDWPHRTLTGGWV